MTEQIAGVSQRFTHPRVVGRDCIDEHGHVNNEVYLRWVLDVATRASSACGWDLERYEREGTAWIVRRHELDYLKQLHLDTEVLVHTWIETYSRITAIRVTEVCDLSGVCAFRAKTTWVHVSRKLLRPVRIPEALVTDFARDR
ncbi:MAG: thioesterase family protein [Deltaproteobacteria bacterium]|nr:thioesterase family protein [Deltaproteobacteria bacterium]